MIVLVMIYNGHVGDESSDKATGKWLEIVVSNDHEVTVMIIVMLL